MMCDSNVNEFKFSVQCPLIIPTPSDHVCRCRAGTCAREAPWHQLGREDRSYHGLVRLPVLLLQQARGAPRRRLLCAAPRDPDQGQLVRVHCDVLHAVLLSQRC